MLEIKTLCPFCDYITECRKPNCNDCPINIENTIKMSEQIAGALRDYWRHQASGAER